MEKKDIQNFMRNHDYISVTRESSRAWIENNYDEDILFSLIVAYFQLKNYKEVCFWAKIYTSVYAGGGLYSDVFSFWMESIYRDNNKNKSIEIIKKEVNLEILKNGLSYHALLYKASGDYMSLLPHMDNFEAAGLIFSRYVETLSYSNNSLRGLQYLVSPKSIDFLSRREKPSKRKVNFVIKKQPVADIWLISLDANYFDKYFSFIEKSMPVVNEAFSIHLHIINPRDEQISKINQLGLSYSTEIFNSKDQIPYYASSRFLIVSDLMDHYKDSNFMITDADVLIHSRLPISLILDDFDIAIRMKEPELYPWRDMGAGLCIVKNNKKMRDFFQLFSKLFDEKYNPERNNLRNTQWWIDQGILYSLINYFGDVNIRKINSELEKKFIFFLQEIKRMR
jgi:hypothetical protein